MLSVLVPVLLSYYDCYQCCTDRKPGVPSPPDPLKGGASPPQPTPPQGGKPPLAPHAGQTVTQQQGAALQGSPDNMATGPRKARSAVQWVACFQNSLICFRWGSLVLMSFSTGRPSLQMSHSRSSPTAVTPHSSGSTCGVTEHH
jgi:hypothetical protein